MEPNRTPTETERVLASMLSENTGRHMLDSGGAYGRNWERNQGKTAEDWLAEPAVSFYASENDFWHVINVFHFLNEAGEYDPEWDHRFGLWAMMGDNREAPWLGLAEEFAQRLVEKGIISGYGVENTYNGEDSLSQTIQYVRFDTDGGEWIYGDMALISIHGGCDVRGGYTRPRAFRLNGNVDLFDNNKGYLYAEPFEVPQDSLPGMEYTPEGISWWTDDGYHWYHDDGLADNLETYDFKEVDSPDQIVPGMGFVAILDGKIYCPVNGTEIQGFIY